MDEWERRALDRLRADQEYRDRLAREHSNFWQRAGIVAAIVAAAFLVASALAQLIHMF